MKRLLFALTLVVALAVGSLGLVSDCPLAGTSQCPLLSQK